MASILQNLTNNLQKFIENNRDRFKTHINLIFRTKWRNTYFFNEVLMQDFVKPGYVEWISPVISGMIEVITI